MEVNSNASRTRVLVAALALGLIAGAIGFARPSQPDESSPSSQSSVESRTSLEGDALLDAAPPRGISFAPSILSLAKLKQASVRKVFVAKPTANQLQMAWKQSTVRMKYLDTCAQSQACAGFDDSEAHSYDLDVRRQTAREIEDFTQISRVWMEQRGGDLPTEAQTIARYFLKNGNDDVKDAAIRLLDLAKPTVANLQSAFGAVKDSSSGPLLKVLAQTQLVKSCAEREAAPACNAFITERAKRGSEGIQRALARNSLAFMTPLTKGTLASIERQQPIRSKNRLHYRLNREEGERFERGG